MKRQLGLVAGGFLLGMVVTLLAVSDVQAGTHNCRPAWKCQPAPSSVASILPTVAPTAVQSASPAPTVVRTASPTATSGTSSMIVGLTLGQWGGSAITDAKAAVDYVSVGTPNGGGESSNITAATNAGLGVIQVRVGPYSSGGVAALDPNAWAASAVAAYRANPQLIAIDILNEPGGSWFWGSGALSQTNATAYARLLKIVDAAFDANGARPKLVASFDGGYAGGSNWGAMVKAADPAAWSYVDGVVVHPYGGTGDRAASALGNRASVASAHTATGLPVWITEVGWPTAVGQPPDGASLQWTEAEQASNITGFVTWARSTGYVAAVTIFHYQDYGSNSWYGITRIGGARKPSFAALAALR